MDEISLTSLAKINIGLNILGKRDDGFHDLETIFYPLLLTDIITIKKSNQLKIVSNSEELNNIKDNLINRSIESLELYCNRKIPVYVNLEKNIPIGAGLGGGSSNAAATLKAITRLYELTISPSDLTEIALSLGSDVPFFLKPVPSLGLSRGEILKKVDLQISQPILIVYPRINISTKWAFEKIKIKHTALVKKPLSSMKKFTLSEVIKFADNDFEEIVFKKYPDIRNIKDQLLNYGATYSSLSGTGSTVYGIFSNLQIARKAEEQFSRNYFTYLNYPVNTGSIT